MNESEALLFIVLDDGLEFWKCNFKGREAVPRQLRCEVSF